MFALAGQREVPVPRGLMYSRAVAGAVDSKIGEVGQLDGESCQEFWRKVRWVKDIGGDSYTDVSVAIVPDFHCIVASGW